MLTFIVRHHFPILVKRLSRKHYTKPSIIKRQWYKKVWGIGTVNRQKESERKSISDRYPIIVQQVVQQQANTLAEAVDNGYVS